MQHWKEDTERRQINYQKIIMIMIRRARRTPQKQGLNLEDNLLSFCGSEITVKNPDNKWYIRI